MKLCNSALRGTSCPMDAVGKPCHYLHDVQAFLASKPPDLGPNCYQYDAYGFCPLTIHCRYGNSHREFDLNNLETKVPFSDLQSKLTPNINCVEKDLQFKLRKRRYNFKKADAACRREILRHRSLVEKTRRPPTA